MTSKTNVSGNRVVSATTLLSSQPGLADTTPPAAPSTPVLDAASDSGVSNSDGVTNKSWLDFSGNAEPWSTVKLYDSDGVTEIGHGETGADGSYHVTVWSLTEGAHQISARAIDIAGNVSAASAATAVTLDTSGPTYTLSSDKTLLHPGGTALITLIFDADPGDSFHWDGSTGDISMFGGTLSAFSGTGLVRTATFTATPGMQPGLLGISVHGTVPLDAAGNTFTGNTLSIVYDPIPPAAPSAPVLSAADDSGVSRSDHLTAVTRPEFSGTAEDGSTVTLYDSDGVTALGSDTAVGGYWRIQTSTLADGVHSISARATDAAGNVSAASAATTFTVDSHAPAAPSAPDLVTDSGVFDTDNLTNVTTPSFTGKAEPGSTVTLYDASGPLPIGTGTADADGNWSIRSYALSDDTYTLMAKATDAAGNTSGASALLTFTIVTKVSTPVLAPRLDYASDDGVSHSDNVTSIDTPAFQVYAPQGYRITLYDNGAEIGSAVPTDLGTITGGRLAPGDHSITYTETDLAGNVSAASPALTLRIVPPAGPKTVTGLALSADHGVSATDFITNESYQTISGSVSAKLDAGEHVQLSLDGGATWKETFASADGWSLSALLDMGTHTLQARVVDAGGQAGPVYTQAYTLDSTAPTLTITSSSTTLKIGETATIAFTFSEDPGASFAWDGQGGSINVSGGTLSALSGSGLIYTAVFTPAPGTDGAVASISVARGYADAAGNAGPFSASPPIYFDTLAPASPSIPALQQDTGLSGSDGLIDTNTPTFIGSGEDGSTVTLYDADTGAVLGASPVFRGQWMVFGPKLPEGPTKVYAVASDSAGNLSAASPAMTVTVDTVAPTLTISSDKTLVTAGQTATITFTFSEDPGTRFSLADVGVANGTLGQLTGSGLVRTAIFTPAVNLAAGSTSIGFHSGLTDAAGNGMKVDNNVLIHIDTAVASPPVIQGLATGSDSGRSPSDNVTNVATPTLHGTKSSNDYSVTLYDSDGTVLGSTATIIGNWSVKTGALADGVHTITAVATDTLSNISVRSGEFTFTIDTKVAAPTGLALDSTAGNTATIHGNAEASASVSVYDSDGTTRLGNATADANGAWQITTGALDAGSHTLTARQTDVAGNTSGASAGLAISIAAPPAPAPAPPPAPVPPPVATIPTTLVDGVPVVLQPAVMPGGASGTSIQIPLIAGQAAIPLLTGSDAGLLVAQLAPGYGLSALGANLAGAAGADSLMAALKTIAPASAPAANDDLAGMAQTFLAGLGANATLAVETVKPVSAAGVDGALTLNAAGGAGNVALVIDGADMKGGSIALRQVGFAAVSGSVDVLADAGARVLSGDGAGQHFTVAQTGNTRVFAGGGDDTLAFGRAAPSSAGGAVHASVAPAVTTTLLHGGAGSDTAVFDGARADFNVEAHNGYLVVSSKAAPENKAMLVDVEQVQFSDTTMAVQESADLQTLAGMYRVVMGRQADVYGFEYWADAHDAGASLGAIVVSLIASAERIASMGGFNGDATHDVSLLYAGLFDRAPDAPGLAFWVDVVHRGVTLDQVADAMLQSAEMIGQQGGPLDWNFSI